MNTFFFGYLSLKWRRLVRFLISPVIVFLLIALNEELISSYNCIKGFSIYFRCYSSIFLSLHKGVNLNVIIGLLIIINLSLIQLGFISWLVKPFIVKDKS